MFDDGYEVTSVRGVERVLVFDDAVGKILCWRIGTTEISASRLGVLRRGGAFRAWAWSPAITNAEATVGWFIELARQQQRWLEASAGHCCRSAAWELAFLDQACKRVGNFQPGVRGDRQEAVA